MKAASSLFSVLCAGLGLTFCLLSLWEVSDIFCLNSGCDVYKGYSLFGVPMYALGAMAFLVLGVLSLSPSSQVLLRMVTGVFLCANMFFLLWQIFFWPCTSCLVVAAILGVFAFHVFRRSFWVWRFLWLAWLFFFFAASLGAVRDGFSPWPILEDGNGDVKVFFSPSCPACKELVDGWIQSDKGGNVAFYPIAKNGWDIDRIAWLQKNLDDGMDRENAFVLFWDEPFPEKTRWLPPFFLMMKLWKNNLVMARIGESRVPFVLSRGIVGTEGPSGLSPDDGCDIFSPSAGTCSDMSPDESSFRRTW
ncbi:hypothetical protein OOT00_15355 [Desulfobotulus sp. H1]|uniref:Vitamin K epoxide reductase domain-containing protein n=1 Tax=Desulfobotulus pelophilus TaxID=2823377 RepID=A0ABT3ND18_9BACT|nr:hypothetical protein [Desulfobotulus pelophilus]MCW7755360.1 hypothetical protein [Desulfobotulus pelophilus]